MGRQQTIDNFFEGSLVLTHLTSANIFDYTKVFCELFPRSKETYFDITTIENLTSNLTKFEHIQVSSDKNYFQLKNVILCHYSMTLQSFLDIYLSNKQIENIDQVQTLEF